MPAEMQAVFAPGSQRASSGAVGHAQMRTSNTGAVLRHLYAAGPMSRAALASSTGLSKASVSSIVAELCARGLLVEGEAARRGERGRPGTEVRVSTSSVAGIGAEINADYLVVTVVDMAGQPRYSTTAPMPCPPAAAAVIDALAVMLLDALREAQRLGLWPAGILVAPPGVIDYDNGVVRFAPNIGWRSVPLVAQLRTAMRTASALPEGIDLDRVPLSIENDAKLSAVAAYFSIARPTGPADGSGPLGPTLRHRAEDLVYLTGDDGVGAGILSGGQLVRGYSGFSGEVGHMRVHRPGRACSCGRSGCWEMYVGLRVLIEATPADSLVRDRSAPMEQRLAELRRLVDDGDARVTAALMQIIEELHGGLEILVDVLNPRVLVLGGYFSWFLDIVLPRVQQDLDQRVLDDGGRVQVTGTPRELDTAAVGGGLMALDRVLHDPSMVPMIGEDAAC